MGPFWLSKNVLKLFHLNDAAHPFGSNRDAHANIGSGHIGLDVFKWIMNDARFDNLPMILETPRHHKKKRAKDELTNEQKSKCPPSMEAKEEIRLLMSLVSKNR
jgi:AP endonuclease-1